MRIENVEELLNLNGIDKELFERKLYQTLLLGVFEAVCKDMKKQNSKIVERDKYRKHADKITATKSIVTRYAGCALTEDGYAQIAKLLSAYFSSGDPRKHFDKSFRELLVNQQEERCAICGKDISSTDAHVDHIIPWEYVGDCLRDNYQMLCETCNTRKGNATYFELSMMLLNKGSKS